MKRELRITDGPFAETKELLASYPPSSRQLRSSGRRAQINGLDMYFELHGRGRPILLLHGGLTTIESSFGIVQSALACSRKVIAAEQQAHGRTPDIERALTHEHMADDTAELLRQLGLGAVDVFGFSMGGATALRHPALIRKLTVVSSAYNVLLRVEHAKEMRRELPNARLEVLDCDDHDPFIGRRAAALIPKFLDS
jgi:pimeloyl-ACP methyl ester carboxylesterase